MNFRTIVLAPALACLLGGLAFAQEPAPVPDLLAPDAEPSKVVASVEVVLLLGILALAPSILMMLTSFTRTVIVLSFVRRALGTQDLPPNAVVFGLSVILTLLVMTPTIASIKKDAVDPYVQPDPAGRITRNEALRRSTDHLRVFMFRHARAADLTLFMDLTRQPRREDGWIEDDVPTEVLIPAFVISELRRAFIMGFAIFLPFLVIDLVVAGVLVSMGMIMLPPALVSLPFKILLFVLVDGWSLVVGSLVRSFF